MKQIYNEELEADTDFFLKCDLNLIWEQREQE